IDQMCSMGLRSGELAGHIIFFTPFLCRHNLAGKPLWVGALSSWRIPPFTSVMNLFNSASYTVSTKPWPLLLSPSIITSLDFLPPAIAPQIMTFDRPLRSSGLMFLGRYLSSLVRQMNTFRKSLPISKQDSSVQTILSQSIHVQFCLSRANANRASTCFGVKRGLLTATRQKARKSVV